MVELDSDDAPLPLSDLIECLSDETHAWLQEADEKEAAWEKIKKSYAFFKKQEDETKNQTDVEANAEVCIRRVRYWTSSPVNPDGCGGIEGGVRAEEVADADGEQVASGGSVKVLYILSDNWQGFGNQIWAASRHIANHLSDADKCRQLLTPLLARTCSRPEGVLVHKDTHPLLGQSFLELGTGGGIPSWTAMWCGARVVATDQAIAGRIRCIAECAERNWRKMKVEASEGDETLAMAGFKPKVCAYDWGSPVNEVVLALNKDGTERFDVIVATDCCFMPWFHGELLDSIEMLMSDRGLALLSFALHGNVSDDEVWGIIDQAEEKGFRVEKLQSQQLTVQKPDMHPKQALVHTLRLTRKSN